MTALVIEGVSVQDLDALDEARCVADDNVAAYVVSHTGCGKPGKLLCVTHAARAHKNIDDALLQRCRLYCDFCHANPLDPATVTVRPI